MLKRILFASLYLVIFAPVYAQRHEDSLKNNTAIDTVAQSQVDTAKHAADSMVKHTTSNNATASHKPAAKKTKKSPTKAAVKQAVATDPEFKHSTVKTISDLKYNAYLKGDDLDNMSLAGDLNHFPSPDSVLKYKKQLDLSPIQVGQLTKLSTELHRKKVEMGGNIIRNEKMLDSLFHSRYIDEGSLIFYTNRSGLYYGEMKGAILMACYKAEKLLTPAQIKKLEALEKNN